LISLLGVFSPAVAEAAAARLPDNLGAQPALAANDSASWPEVVDGREFRTTWRRPNGTAIPPGR